MPHRSTYVLAQSRSEDASSSSSMHDQQDSTSTRLTFLSTSVPEHKAWLCRQSGWWAPWHAGEEAVGAACRLLWDSGTWCLVLAAFVFALSVLFVKLTAGRIPVLEITLIRSALSWVVSVALAKLQGMPWNSVFGNKAKFGWLISRGVTGALAMTMYYGSLMLLPMGDAVSLFFLNPAITAVMAFLIRGEPLGWEGAAGCLASLAGLLLIMHPPVIMGGHEDWGPSRLMGVGLGVGSAILAAAAFISIRFIGRSEPALTVSLWFHSSTLIISAVPLAFAWPEAAMLPGARDGGLLLGVAATSFLGQLLLTRGFQLMDAGRASSINFTQVVHSYIFGVLCLHEHPTLLGGFGSLLVAAGVALANARQRSSEPDKAPLKLSAQARDIAGAGVGSVLSLHGRRGGYAALESTEEGAVGAEEGAGGAEEQGQQQREQHDDRSDAMAGRQQPEQELAKLASSQGGRSTVKGREDQGGASSSPITQQPSRDVALFVIDDTE